MQPGTRNLNLVAKVCGIESTVDSKPSDKITTVTIGDETGCVYFSARNEQLRLLKVGATIVVRNGHIDLFNKHMRLKVDKWGLLQSFEDGQKNTTVQLSDKFTVNTATNVSNKEYKVVIEYV